MKNTFIILIVSLLITSSCKDWLSINNDPKNITEVTVDLVLPAVQNNYIREITSYLYPLYWSQYLSYSKENYTSSTAVNYILDPVNADYLFANMYSNLVNIDYIEIKSSSDQKNTYYTGIAKVLKALHFQVLTDCFGDIPYSEALMADKNMYPKYDKDVIVYEGILRTLDEALLILKQPGNVGTLSYSDIFFKGNISRWIKFANTLKLRILLRQSDVSARSSYVQSEIAKLEKNFLTEGENVYCNPGYVASANNMLPPYYYTWGKNYSGGEVTNYNTHRPSSVFVNFLQENNDPRMHVLLTKRTNITSIPTIGTDSYYQFYNGKQYVGIVPGHTSNQAPSTTYVSKQGLGIIYSPNQNSVVMTAAESFFLQAEAVQKGLITGDAKALYQKGIEQSFLQYDAQFKDVKVLTPTINDVLGAARTYYLQTNVPDINLINWDLSNDKLGAIYYQKWVALFGHGAVEAWTEFRRTGYPKLKISTSADGIKKHVARYLYPYQEEIKNGSNVPKNINAFTSLIFWDKENPDINN